MDAIGSQEVHFPALIPREIFEASGRWADYGDLLFRLHDRKDADYLLAPTHEELFTLLVKGEYSSYKDYPLALYQIQTKYRDEARPRAGILRGREFVMKDSYSFDLSTRDSRRPIARTATAYERIFTRLGFDYRIVFAVSGAMGGSASEEFLAPAPSGEDTFVQCTNCDYAANTEAVEIAAPPADGPGRSAPPQEVLDTPDTPTIESLVERDEPARRIDRRPPDTLKNVVLRTRAPGTDEWELLVVGVPGDREVDLKRIGGAARAGARSSRPAPDDLAKQPELVKGYIGPQRLAELEGALPGRPARGRGQRVGHRRERRGQARRARGARARLRRRTARSVRSRSATATAAPAAVRALQIARGIELGHVFQLGRKYAETFGLTRSGQDGKPVTVTMGSYGVGVTRAVAAIAEQTYDEKGLCWPRSVAPADVHLVATGKDDAVFAAADALAARARSAPACG